MTEITKEEKRSFAEYCNELAGQPNLYEDIYTYYHSQDGSFEYLFLLQRVKIAAANGGRSLMKTIKEIQQELKYGAQVPMPRNPHLRRTPGHPGAVQNQVEDLFEEDADMPD